MTPEPSENAVLTAAGLGMVAGVLLMEYAVPLGTYPTAIAVFVAAAAASGAGLWLLPDAETREELVADRVETHQQVQDGDPS